MKNRVIILFLFFSIQLTSGSLADHCGHDMDRTWFYTSNFSSNYQVSKSRAKYQKWTFKNKTDKQITIYSVGLWSKGKKVMKEQTVKKYLKPFGVVSVKMYVGDLNLDVAGSGFSKCEYGKPVVKKNTYNQKPSTYSKPKTYYKPKTKKRRNDDNFTLFNLFLLAVAGILILVFVAATKKNEYKKYVKKFPKVFDFTDQTITCFKKYSTFKGRAQRKEYWYFYLFTFIVSVLTYFIDVSIFRKNPDGILFINAFFSMLTFLPSIAAGCRRLHDVNKSGWWQLISLTVIGIIPLIIWLASKPVKENNKF